MRTVSYDELSSEKLRTIVAQWRRSKIAVVGDFFLDRYLIIDPELTEQSIETGLDAYQVVEKRPQPGAAGTVASNLVGLDVGRRCVQSRGPTHDGRPDHAHRIPQQPRPSDHRTERTVAKHPPCQIKRWLARMAPFPRPA